MKPHPTKRGRGLVTVVGAINWDIIIFEERFARPGEEVPVRLVEEFPGGKGANVAVAAARILGRGRVALIAALGQDEVSEIQLSGLRSEGVSTEGVVIKKGMRSGRAYILVDDSGRKTIHTHFGANESLTPTDLDSERVSRVLSRSEMVVLMDPPTDVALAVARAVDGKSRLLYSPGVRVLGGLRSLRKIMEFADVLVLDTNEFMNLSQNKATQEAIDGLRRQIPELVVVATLGEKGCVVARRGVSTSVEGVDLAKLRLRAVNSTGSGDAFLAAFAGYLLMGLSPVEAAAWGNLAGALKATRYETRGSPERRTLESSMKSLERLRLRPRG